MSDPAEDFEIDIDQQALSLVDSIAGLRAYNEHLRAENQRLREELALNPTPPPRTAADFFGITGTRK